MPVTHKTSSYVLLSFLLCSNQITLRSLLSFRLCQPTNHNMTFPLCSKMQYTYFLPHYLKYCVMLNHYFLLLSSGVKSLLLYFEHTNDVTMIMKLHIATRFWLLAPHKCLTMIVTSFLRSKCDRIWISMQ